MKAITLSTSEKRWEPGSPLYGESSIHNGKQLTQLKTLSDCRREGGGIAFVVKFSLPQGKLINLVAVARSDEHVYILEGGYCDKLGEQRRFPGDYALNSKGHSNGGFIGRETVALVIYTGEPDEVLEFAVIDPEPAQQGAPALRGVMARVSFALALPHQTSQTR